MFRITKIWRKDHAFSCEEGTLKIKGMAFPSPWGRAGPWLFRTIVFYCVDVFISIDFTPSRVQCETSSTRQLHYKTEKVSVNYLEIYIQVFNSKMLSNLTQRRNTIFKRLGSCESLNPELHEDSKRVRVSLSLLPFY